MEEDEAQSYDSSDYYGSGVVIRMFDFERATDYIRSLELPGSELCEEIRTSALAGDVPIIRPETASFLLFLIQLQKPARILEVGTAVGYSAIRMSEVMPEGAAITTIEKYPPRVEEAKRNFKRAPRGDDITLLEGDAAEILKTLGDPFDFIFMDAAKGQYIHFLPDVLRLLAPGGLLFSDNVLQDGDVLESRFAVTRRNRTIHSRMREYLTKLTHMDGFVTSVIPIGDGVSLTTAKTVPPEHASEGAEMRKKDGI